MQSGGSGEAPVDGIRDFVMKRIQQLEGFAVEAFTNKTAGHSMRFELSVHESRSITMVEFFLSLLCHRNIW